MEREHDLKWDLDNIFKLRIGNVHGAILGKKELHKRSKSQLLNASGWLDILLYGFKLGRRGRENDDLQN